MTYNHPKDKKFYDAKARSIVAMLFWEWRKQVRVDIEENVNYEFNDGAYAYIDALETSFKKPTKC